MNAGLRIDEIGILVRDGGGFRLRRDAGGSYWLELSRMPIDEVEKRVRIVGTLMADDVVFVDGVSLADR